jgi:hypothetical protein
VITTVGGIGSTSSTFNGDNIQATTAVMRSPFGLALDSPNNLLYISFTQAGRIRRINLNTGIITTVAGTGTYGSPTGDGGPATNATLGSVHYTLQLDPIDSTKLYFAENGYASIRMVNLANNTITKIAGRYSVGSLFF